MEQVKIKLNGGIMPRKATPTDAAWDLYVPEDVLLRSGRQVIDLKFSMELPHGYAATIQPRSGFSLKGIEVDFTRIIEGQHCTTHCDSYRLDADVIRGLIDESYRDNVGVILYVSDCILGKDSVVLKKNTRIAQMQIVKVPQVELVESKEIDMSNNRGGGFGHTGTK